MLKNPQWDWVTRKQVLRLLCYQDFQLFVQVFFQHHCPYPFSRMHQDFFQTEAQPNRRGRREVIAAPRGHAKTTFKVLFKCIHSIVYGYEDFILIIGHSAPEANKKVWDILNELETNTLLQDVFGPLAPARGKLGWSTKDFVTQNNIRVMAKSRGNQVRGLKHGSARPTLIILDDAESPEKVYKEEQRHKTREWFEKDILKLGSVDDSANVVVIGTCLHQEALLPQLLMAPGWKGKKYQAIERFADNQALWNEWKGLYVDLANPNHVADAHAFYQANQEKMLADTQVLWPEAEPYERLMRMIINEGQASFQSEKQNDPYDPERQIFNMQAAKRFRMEFETNGDAKALHWLDGSQRVILATDITKVIAFHDPAMAENQNADYAAIVVCAQDCHGYIYCLDAYIEKVPPSRQIEQAFALHKKWYVTDLYLEDNNFQGLLKQNYRDMMPSDMAMRVRGVTQAVNKQKRIAALEPLVTNGILLFNENLNPRLITQLTLFPTCEDDGPDALHGCVEKLRKGRMPMS